VIDRTSNIFSNRIVPEFDQVNQDLLLFLNENPINLKQRILSIKTASKETHLIACKIYQVLKKTREDSYIFSETSVSEEKFDENLRVFSNEDSMKTFVLIVNEHKCPPLAVKDKMFKIIADNPNKKLIILCDEDICSNDPNVHCLVEDSVELKHLMKNSITKILEKTIKFQDINIKFDQIISQNQTENFSVKALLDCESIGQNVITLETYDRDLYINRTLGTVLISKNYLSDSEFRKNNKCVFTQNNFESTCQQNPGHNVHLLEKNDGDKFQWLKTKGRIQELRKHIDENNIKHLDEDIINDLNRQSRVEIIVNNAGMGKTYLLNHLAESFKEKYQDHWIINVTLNEHTNYFNENKITDDESVIRFLTTVLKISPNDLEIDIFRESILRSGKVVIIIDGFDEIASDYGQLVLKLLETILTLPVKKVIISTRPEMEDTLENKFNQFGLSLLPFQENEQRDLLTKYWNKKFGENQIFEEYSNKLINFICADKEYRDFTQNPLTLKLIGEVYQDEAQQYSLENTTEIAVSFFNMYKLFERYVEEKLKIYFDQKMKLDSSNSGTREIIEKERTIIENCCYRLAIQFVLSQVELETYFKEFDLTVDPKDLEVLTKYGILMMNGKFIHKYFAEYFFFDFLIHHVENPKNPDLIFNVILNDEKYDLIQNFLINYYKSECHWIEKNIETKSDSETIGIGIILQSLRAEDYKNYKDINEETWNIFERYIPYMTKNTESLARFEKILGSDFIEKFLVADLKTNNCEAKSLWILKYMSEKYLKLDLLMERQNFLFEVVESSDDSNIGENIHQLFDVLKNSYLNRNVLEKLLLKEDSKGNTFLYILIKKNVDAIKISEFLEWVGAQLGPFVLKKLFKSSNSGSFYNTISTEENQNLVKNYLKVASEWFNSLHDENPSFDKFEEALVNSTLNLLFLKYSVKEHVKSDGSLKLDSDNSEFVEHFAMIGLKWNLKDDHFIEKFLSILSKRNLKDFQLFFESKLDDGSFQRKMKISENIIIKHCNKKDFQNSAINTALENKNVQTFKFIIRSLPVDGIAVEILGKSLCHYFKNFQDKSDILNVISITKELNFVKKLLISKFMSKESNKEETLLCCSMNHKTNCLNLIDFVIDNFISDIRTIETILSLCDGKNENLIDKIVKSILKNKSNKYQNIKLLRKVVQKFENNSPETFQILKNLFLHSTGDVGLIKFFEMTIFAESSLEHFSDKNSDLSDFLNEYKTWKSNSKNQKKYFVDFIGIFKESAFVEILNRNGCNHKIGDTNLISLGNFELDFIQQIAFLYLNEKLMCRDFLHDLFDSYLLLDEHKVFRIYFNLIIDKLEVNHNFVGSVLKKEISQIKSTKIFYSVVIQENLLSILQFVLKSLREVFSELEQNILIEFLSEKVFYPILFLQTNCDYNLLRIFKLNLGDEIFDKIFLAHKTLNLVTQNTTNLFLDFLKFPNSFNRLNNVVMFLIDESSDILREILNYRSEDGGSFLHLIISRENILKLLETEFTNLIIGVIKKLFEHIIDQKEIETFILVQNASEETFLHLLSEHDFSTNKISEILKCIYQFEKLKITEKLIAIKDKKELCFYDCYDLYIPDHEQNNIEELFKLLEKSKSLTESEVEKLKKNLNISKSHNLKLLLKNCNRKEEVKVLSKIFKNKSEYPEITSRIESFFENQLQKNEKLIVEYLEMRMGKEIEFLLYLLFDILIKHLEAGKDPEMVQKVLFVQMGDKLGRGFLHSLCSCRENRDEKLIKNIFEKLKEIKKYFPDSTFKQLFLLKDNSRSFTFLSCNGDFDAFKIAFNFIKSELGDEFFKEILFSEDRDGGLLHKMTYDINGFIFVLRIFKEDLNKSVIKQFLMHKNKKKQNFLVFDLDNQYSDPENLKSLLQFFDLIFSIFSKDIDLFNDLLKSKDEFDYCFMKILQESYNNENKFEKIKNWIKNNLMNIDDIDKFYNSIENSKNINELRDLKIHQIIPKSRNFKSIIQNFKDREESKFLSKIVENKNQYPKIALQIEIFFEKQLQKNDKLIVEYLEMKIGKEIEFLLYFLFDILIKHLEAGKGSEMVQKVLFAQMNDRDGNGFLHSLFRWPENNDKKLIENILEKLNEIKKHFPETIFKQLFLLKEKSSSFTFLSYIADSDGFKVAFNFIKSELGDEFLKEILCSEDRDGDLLFNMTYIINRFIFVLELFKENLDKTFIKRFLMHKNNKKANLLVRDHKGIYSDPAQCKDLKELLNLIYVIFDKDFDLFNDLLKSEDENGDYFKKKILKKYKKVDLKYFKSFIKKTLDEDCTDII
jgi:hypothetical protein